MVMFTVINTGGNNFTLEQNDNLMPGRGRAVGFMSEVNRKIKDLGNTPLSNEQAVMIKNAITIVRDTCKTKNKFLYFIQSKLNPFSDAWKIERISKNILSVVSRVIKSDMESIESNVDNPYEFFSVNNIDDIKKDTKIENLGYVFYSPNSLQYVTNPDNLLNYRGNCIPLPVYIDSEKNCIKFMTKEEIKNMQWSTTGYRLDNSDKYEDCLNFIKEKGSTVVVHQTKELLK